MSPLFSPASSPLALSCIHWKRLYFRLDASKTNLKQGWAKENPQDLESGVLNWGSALPPDISGKRQVIALCPLYSYLMDLGFGFSVLSLDGGLFWVGLLRFPVLIRTMQMDHMVITWISWRSESAFHFQAHQVLSSWAACCRLGQAELHWGQGQGSWAETIMVSLKQRVQDGHSKDSQVFYFHSQEYLKQKSHFCWKKIHLVLRKLYEERKCQVRIAIVPWDDDQRGLLPMRWAG